MASLNFEESIVLVLFAESIGDPAPSRQQIVQFDSDLQATFGAKLVTIMTEEHLAVDIHTRSAVLGCRPNMAGDTPDSQIRNACRYVLHAQQELAAPSIAALVPTAATASPTSVRAAKRAKPASRRSGQASRRRRRTGS